MASGRPRGLLPGILGLVAFGAVVAWFGIVKPQGPGEAPPSAAAALPSQNQPMTTTRPEQTAKPATPADALDAARDQVRAAAMPAAPIPPPPEEAGKSGGPSFDVVRVESSGDSVIAGRGAPGATIEMLRNGKSHARVIADTSGLFAFVPPPLRPGSHEIVLSSVAPDGTRAQSRDSVTVVINDDRATRPLVTLTSPDRPTVVLSAPEPSPRSPVAASPPPSGVPGSAPAAVAAAPAPTQNLANGDPQPPVARPPVKIGSVEAEEGGRLFVSGQAAPGATVRLYLNESFIAPGGTGHDGKVSFAIGRGVRPGDYRVRLDDVDPVSGQVKSRAEVAFNVPAPLTVALPPHAPPHLPGSDLPGATASAPLKAITPLGSSTVAGSGALDPGSVVVPEVNTAVVARGDNLWRISRRIYGQGTRYTVIYDANQRQIRNPDRIYPGQLFVLPPEKTATP
jgi:nucleoid-associated protein YgaU